MTNYNYSIKINEEFKSVEVYFSGKPDTAVRTAMKSAKMRWNPTKKCWYSYLTSKEVKAILDDCEKLEIPETQYVTEKESSQYDEWAGWTGGNSSKWNTDKELKGFLLADFKKAKIKATVRFNRAGYLTALTCTLKISKADIKTYDEWKELNIPFRNWGSQQPYTDADGNISYIWDSEIDENDMTMMENIRYTTYKIAVMDMEHRRYATHQECKLLKGKAARDYSLIRKIVTSYNYDSSDSQRDYFNRGIYDTYVLKITD